jgi:hypothetical protein
MLTFLGLKVSYETLAFLGSLFLFLKIVGSQQTQRE